jgi:hypothetical protein
MHAETGNPLSDILVYCEGLQATTDGNGKFSLYPLDAGEHRLTAYAMNGAYIPFQQQVVTKRTLSTNVEIPMQPADWKKVTFTVTVPEETVDGAPIRLAGNLTQLGHTFTDLGGGLTGDVHNMPVLEKNEVGRFVLTMDLPAGIDIRYKFTLGDGFWNAEHGLDQSFVIHNLIIPPDSDDVYIHDTVSSWKSSETEPIWFQVNTPPNTPPDESIGIQFQLADWMPSLPMFKIDEGSWAYPLISPHNFSGTISYRYCRNGPCTGSYQPGVEALPIPRESETQFSEVQLISEEVIDWVTLSKEVQGVSIDHIPQTREAEFIAGISYSPYYSLTSLPFMDASIRTVSRFVNQVVFSPAWVGKDPNLPTYFSADHQKTPMWHEIAQEIETAKDLNLRTGVFPQVIFDNGYEAWWETANTDDESWWMNWILQYREFIFQFADLAHKTEAEVLIIGGEWIYPSIPLKDHFERYHQPGNIEQLWVGTIRQVREKFGGKIALQIPIDYVSELPPSLLGSVDQLYLQWDIPLQTTDAGGEEMIDQIRAKLDAVAEPLKTNLNKPIILVLAYPSAQGFSEGCILSQVEPDTCLDDFPLLYGPSEQTQAATDLDAQTEFYINALTALDERLWIDGVISQGYYPAIQMHDPSASIHGKPAEEIVIQWFQRFLGK